MRLLICLYFVLLNFSLLADEIYPSQQDSSILAYNRAVEMILEPFDSPSHELVRLEMIEELLHAYCEREDRPEHSIRRLLSTAISMRAEAIYSHAGFPTEIQSYELLDSLCLRMVVLAEELDKAQQIQNAAIHFHNAGNLALQSAGYQNLKEVNMFEPSVEVRIAWKCFTLSDMYAEMYHSLTGEKSIVPKMEWSPY